MSTARTIKRKPTSVRKTAAAQNTARRVRTARARQQRDVDRMR